MINVDAPGRCWRWGLRPSRPLKSPNNTRCEILFRSAIAAGVLWIGSSFAAGEEGADRQPPGSMSLEQAIFTAIDWNLDIQISSSRVEQVSRQTDQVRSDLLPRLNVDSRYRHIDEDRSATGGENLAEYRTTIGGAVTQVLFDDLLVSRYRAAGREEERQRFEHQALTIDVAAEAARRFLEYQEDQERERIQRENLKRSQRFLEFAQAQNVAGAGSRSDVYRWESQVASQTGLVKAARARSLKSLTDVNQFIGLDPGLTWLPEMTDPSETRFYRLGAVLAGYTDEPVNAASSTRFLVDSSITNSPALRAIDKAIEGQEILLGQARRRYFTPRLRAGFRYDYIIDQNFAGESLATTIENLGFPADDIPTRDDEEWTFLVTATFPLFEGGDRKATVGRDEALLTELTDTRMRTRDILDRNTRNAIHGVQGSYPNIEFARSAEDLSRKNLALVEEKYRQGAALIVELTDAQSDTFNKEALAILSLYTYLKDLVELQRATSRMEGITPGEDLQDWLREFVAAVKAPAPVATGASREP